MDKKTMKVTGMVERVSFDMAFGSVPLLMAVRVASGAVEMLRFERGMGGFDVAPGVLADRGVMDQLRLSQTGDVVELDVARQGGSGGLKLLGFANKSLSKIQTGASALAAG